MGLLDGVERILEEKVFKRTEAQFRELICEMIYIREELKSTNKNLRELIEIEKEKHGRLLGQSREV